MNYFLLFVVLVAVALSFRYYGSLLQRVAHQGEGLVDVGMFGPKQTVFAGVLGVWFGFNLVLGAMHGEGGEAVQGSAVLFSILIYVVLIGGIFALFIRQGDRPSVVFGLDRMPILSVLWRGGAMLLAAYPMVAAAMWLVAWMSRGTAAPQDIVEFFAGTTDRNAARWVIVMGVAVAPVAEEFLFRGFFYGVLKRHFGILPGIFGNALLFAIIHMNPSSIPALGMLAICLTLAYEITGSLLVPMAMHAAFNTLSLVVLVYFPEAAR